jgi:deazaflavin-dependent oxidoreductase (nitroreductase family)
MSERDGPRRNIVAGEPVKLRVVLLDMLLRPWFAHGPHRGMGVLTTVGRRTGKARRHAVRAIRKGGKVYVVSIPGPHAAWLQNLRAHPDVVVQLKGARLEGKAHEVRDHERAEARATYVGTVNWADYVECFLHWRGRPRKWKIQRLHQMWFDGGIPVVIDLEAAPGAA